METKQKGINVIHPTDEVHYLTQKTLADDAERIFLKEIWLGKYDSPDNYIEIDEAEKERLEAIEKQKRDNHHYLPNTH